MLQYDSSLDAAFAALADPTRREVVARLCDGELSVGKLAEPLDMSLSAVGQHLRILEQSGLIVSEKRGRTRFCRVDHQALSAVESWLGERRRHAEQRLDRLQSFVERRGNSDD
ncbi:helix-turn-helix transcriptional regulator [Sulfitobacter sp. S0837]|uniref:ArsR/SmtB family transcription factor n=1 Tax=Sulfitobacter pontiacus TaxID=60137 RepID=UPI001581D6DD|nr:metalloregulator ArsR/SmtB family transcription factor [Sulfitobacter pontiacus]NUH65232.1 helix-turn-helix transcriptional regulator [Sulfitobacter maritimus]GLO79994.1 transcriptional regulator [Sulfitobacter pontiacus]